MRFISGQNVTAVTRLHHPPIRGLYGMDWEYKIGMQLVDRQNEIHTLPCRSTGAVCWITCLHTDVGQMRDVAMNYCMPQFRVPTPQNPTNSHIAGAETGLDSSIPTQKSCRLQQARAWNFHMFPHILLSFLLIFHYFIHVECFKTISRRSQGSKWQLKWQFNCPQMSGHWG